MKSIYIYSNDDSQSKETELKITSLLKEAGITVTKSLSNEVELAIAIGGDGTFLSAVKSIEFKNIPILGINTGHLGFFAEISDQEIDKLVSICKEDKFIVQKHNTINCIVKADGEETVLSPALNDVLIKHGSSSLIHLDLNINSTLIEKFSGDGILVSSSAGSTAYNYSLGGSLIDPRLKLLQITPVAPANNATYRSITSSLLLPGNEKIVITPIDTKDAIITVDGEQLSFENIDEIIISLSEKEVSIVRLPAYDFWSKVKTKFL